MNIWKILGELLFDEEFDIQHKLLNLILSAAVVGGTLSLLVTMFMGGDKFAWLSIIILVVVVCVSLYLSVVKRKTQVAAVLIVGMANTIIFPVMYVFSGGMKSGMPIWFVLGLIFSWLILKGKICGIMFALNTSTLLACLLVEHRYPALVKSLDRTAMTSDIAQSMIIVSCIFGAIFKYQSYVYEKQKLHLLQQEEQLRNAMDELTRANQAKSDFLANMSHEIRTPINAVLGMDEMILRESREQEVILYAQNIQSAGNTLLSLINDILDFSKIESGKMEILPVEYEMSSLINDCYHMILMRATEKNLSLQVENDETIPRTLFGDEIRIRQVVSNLLTNAVKYTEKGYVKLKLDWSPLEAGMINLKISVEDSGMGISEENQKILFASFQRIEERKNRNIEGTGLGLTITKQLVSLMGGTISVKSELKRGSTFVVEIPQRMISDKPIGNFMEKYADAVNQNAKYEESFQAPEAQLLVVDDVKMNLDVIKGLLKNTKVQVDTAQSGRECLEKAAKKKYHIIFMDHMMPEMDGIETLYQLRIQTDLPNAKTTVIALTANAIIGAEEEYLAKGFSDYLSKPVRGKELEKMVIQYLPQELIIRESKDEKQIRTQQEVQQSTEKKDAVPESGWLEQLAFLNVKLGLSYCMGDEGFYKEMLRSFVEDSKYDELLKYYSECDKENYRIKVHAVKSTSLSLGAEELSSQAKQMEEAVKADNWEYVQEQHEAFMEQYRDVLHKMKKAIE